MRNRSSWLAGAGLLALLAAVLWLYWPGLYGPLVLDSTIHLKRLESLGPIADWDSFFRFVLSNSSTYPNRPIAYATFTMNDIGWPVYIFMHKYTNVLIHLLNGILVFWLSVLLCRILRVAANTALLVGLSTTALWMLAPLQVSTVLYVIQRMTELSALFVLAGLISYCYGRQRLNAQPVLGFVQMTTGIAIFGLLGFLSKEIALLITLYALAMERTLAKHCLPPLSKGVGKALQIWKWAVLVLPLAGAFAILFAQRGFLYGYGTRPFTAYERLISQPRILFEYLQDLLLPIRTGMGVAHDDYMLSTGLTSPAVTLIAIVALVTMVAAAVYMSRKSTSLLAFAALWYLAGHLMESSILPLEPYFEHRNYLPALGPFFALACFIWRTEFVVSRYLKIGLGVYLVLFATVTHQNVRVWSNKLLIGETWAADHPRSVRAQQIRADVWSLLGDDRKAHEALTDIAELRPDAMSPQLQLLLSGCRADPRSVSLYLEQTRKRLDRARFDHAVIPTLTALASSRTQRCPKLSRAALLDLVDSIIEHETVYRRARAKLLYVKATILAQTSEYQAAASHLFASFRMYPTYDMGLISVKFFYDLRQYSQALKILDEVKAIQLRRFSPDRFRDKEIESWHIRIAEKMTQ